MAIWFSASLCILPLFLGIKKGFRDLSSTRSALICCGPATMCPFGQFPDTFTVSAWSVSITRRCEHKASATASVARRRIGVCERASISRKEPPAFFASQPSLILGRVLRWAQNASTTDPFRQHIDNRSGARSHRFYATASRPFVKR